MGLRPTVKTLCPTWVRGRVEEGESIVRPIFLLQTEEKQGVARGILKMMPLRHAKKEGVGQG